VGAAAAGAGVGALEQRGRHECRLRAVGGEEGVNSIAPFAGLIQTQKPSTLQMKSWEYGFIAPHYQLSIHFSSIF
jgi:hypothetical protein